MWAAVAAALTVVLSVSGCVGSARACPMDEVASSSEVDATAYVRAHPGLVAEMGACLGAPSVCGVAQAEAHLVPVSAARAAIEFGDQPAGQWRVEVVLVGASGQVVLDATGLFVIVHAEKNGCRNISFDHGGAAVTATGTVTH